MLKFRSDQHEILRFCSPTRPVFNALHLNAIDKPPDQAETCAYFFAVIFAVIMERQIGELRPSFPVAT